MKEWGGRLRVKSVRKDLKGCHVEGRLDFSFGPGSTTRAREAAERALIWKSDRPQYKFHTVDDLRTISLAFLSFSLKKKKKT